MKTVKRMLAAAVFAAGLVLCACKSDEEQTLPENTNIVTGEFDTGITSRDIENAIPIRLDGENAYCDESSVKIETGEVKIKSGGTYILYGSYIGSVKIKAAEAERVNLVLDGVSIVSEGGKCIFAKQADNVVIYLKDGSDNRLVADVKNVSEEDLEKAAIQSKVSLAIDGNGSLDIASPSIDAINSDENILINGGNIVITAGDDGIHSDKSVVINSGSVDIKECCEGIEGAGIYINGGCINIVASDDGINATDGNSTNARKGDSGKNKNADSGNDDILVCINGGTVNIDAAGDGLDSNGRIEMNGGYIYVSGSVNDKNNATDYDTEFVMNGGTIIATGMSGMYQSIAENSKNMVIDYKSGKLIEEGSLIKLMDENLVLLEFTLVKSGNAVMISMDELEEGKEYTLVVENETVTVTATKGTGSEMNFGGPGGGPGGPRGDFDGKDGGPGGPMAPPDGQEGGFGDPEGN